MYLVLDKAKGLLKEIQKMGNETETACLLITDCAISGGIFSKSIQH